MPEKRAVEGDILVDADTRTRILDVAERLFAERGFHAVSLREITAEARANNAAIFYYFRRKEDLFAEVVERRAAPLVEERVARIEALLARSTPPTLEELIEAYLAPGLTIGFGSATIRKHFGRIRARFTPETDPAARGMLHRHFHASSRRFLHAVGRLLPALQPRDLQWRYHIMVGTLIYLLAQPGRVQAVGGDPPDTTYNPDDMDEALRFAVPLIAAIFRAPSIPDTMLEPPDVFPR